MDQSQRKMVQFQCVGNIKVLVREGKKTDALALLNILEGFLLDEIREERGIDGSSDGGK